MAYAKQTWIDGPAGGTPLSAARLSHIEDGIARVDRLRLPPPRGAVCFTWDDGRASHAAVAAIHEARNQRATFGITQNLVGGSNLSAGQISALAAAGHELASHSVTHSNFVTQLTAAQRAAEYAQSKAYVESLAGQPCTTWIYPFGGAARNSTTDQEAYLVYERLLDVAGDYGRAHDPDFSSPLLQRMNLTGTVANHNFALGLIRQAAVRRVVPIFLCHELDTAGAPTTTQYTELCDLCVSLSIPVVRVDEAFGGASTVTDAGFEDPTLGAWQVVRDVGTQVVESAADTPVAGLAGARSLHLNVANGGFAYVAQPVEVRQGVGTYTLSGRYRTTAGVGSATVVRCRQYGYDAVQVGGAPVGATLSEATSWTRFSTAFTPNASTKYVNVELVLDPAAGVSGEAWIDHVHFGPTVLGSFG